MPEGKREEKISRKPVLPHVCLPRRALAAAAGHLPISAPILQKGRRMYFFRCSGEQLKTRVSRALSDGPPSGDGPSQGASDSPQNREPQPPPEAPPGKDRAGPHLLRSSAGGFCSGAGGPHTLQTSCPHVSPETRLLRLVAGSPRLPGAEAAVELGQGLTFSSQLFPLRGDSLRVFQGRRFFDTCIGQQGGTHALPALRGPPGALILSGLPTAFEQQIEPQTPK